MKEQVKSKNLGLELLRIISMLMIVMLHTLGRSDLLNTAEVTSCKYAFVWLVEILCYCAVNCFILISGYVGAHLKFSLSRICHLYIQVLFYNVLFALIYQVAEGKVDLIRTIRAGMPLFTKAYWFFCCYYILYFFMPFINKLIEVLTHKQRMILVGSVLLFFSFIPAIVMSPIAIIGSQEVEYVSTKQGYSVFWFGIMYMLGAILRWTIDENRIKPVPRYLNIVVYLICVGLAWRIWCIYSISSGGKAWFAVSYTSPLIVLSAISLFMFFNELNVSKNFKRYIEYMAESAFGVYLIHSNKWVYGTYVEGVKPLANMNTLELLIVLPTLIVGVYFVCTIMDKIRIRIFEKLNLKLGMLDNCAFVKYLRE